MNWDEIQPILSFYFIFYQLLLVFYSASINKSLSEIAVLLTEITTVLVCKIVGFVWAGVSFIATGRADSVCFATLAWGFTFFYPFPLEMLWKY
jgi:hypothetical protein